ncbi:hypothetical protein [Pseudomonas frederiksbergensis]|nr:hypothetical protein [Pseudomonas frederiksbergensis]
MPLINQTTYATVVKDETPWPSDPSVQPRSLVTIPMGKRPIFIFAFVHDDVPESRFQSIYPAHFLPMVKELKIATGRDVSVKFIRKTPPYTSYVYRGENQTSYDGWKALGEHYRDNNNLPFGRTTKFLLLTNDWMNSHTLGITAEGQQFGLATVASQQIVGHEVGHMLTAQHELSEIRYNGWLCETFMIPKVNPLYSSCFVYTDPNRARINNFLADTP